MDGNPHRNFFPLFSLRSATTARKRYFSNLQTSPRKLLPLQVLLHVFLLSLWHLWCYSLLEHLRADILRLSCFASMRRIRSCWSRLVSLIFQLRLEPSWVLYQAGCIIRSMALWGMKLSPSPYLISPPFLRRMRRQWFCHIYMGKLKYYIVEIFPNPLYFLNVGLYYTILWKESRRGRGGELQSHFEGVL